METNTVALHDPQLAGRRSLVQGHNNAPEETENSRFVLPSRPEHDNSGVFTWWIDTDVAEIEIKGNEDPVLSGHAYCNRVVGRP